MSVAFFLSATVDVLINQCFRPSSQCHYTYVTKFQPSQEKICEENFEKICQISFSKKAHNDTVQKCHKPVSKVCEGPRMCKTVYETSCSTKYVELEPGKLGTNTHCKKLPIEVCGDGCSFKEEEEKCHEETIMSFIEIPEEICELNPQKTCRFTTKLVPKLEPVKECTVVAKETCQLSFSKPSPSKKPLTTKWCLDESQQNLSEKKKNNDVLDRDQHLNNRSTKKTNDIEILPETNKSIEDPTLNTRNIFLSFEDDISEENMEDKNILTASNKKKVKPKNIVISENPILDVRVGLSSRTSRKLHRIERVKVAPKKSKRNSLSQDAFQTRF